MAYLGLDTSTVSTGWGVISKTGELIAHGVINPDKELAETEKLAIQYAEFVRIIREYDIKRIRCEDQHMRNNPKTMKQLVRVSTTALLSSVTEGVPFDFKAPSAWRKITHGTGAANKAMTTVWVNETFNMSFLKKHNDITDGIGIAYSCYLDYK